MTMNVLRALIAVSVAGPVACLVACAARPTTPSRDAREPVAVRIARPAPEFDSRREAAIEVRWSDGKTPLVRPLVNGHNVGWFVLDTGASGMTITRDAARAAGLAPVGTTLLQGERLTTVYESDSFELGPLILSTTRFAEMDMPGSAFTFGADAVGFCGYDVFAGAVFVLDAEAGSASLHDPATHDLTTGSWQPLAIHRNLPHVRARFEGDREGLFLIDAGFDGDVWLFAETVREAGLLEDRPTRERTIVNLGGTSSVQLGALDWFELGGHRIDDVECAFSVDPVPVYVATPEVIGIVGIRFLRRFRLVLDYGGERVAFVAHEEDGS